MSSDDISEVIYTLESETAPTSYLRLTKASSLPQLLSTNRTFRSSAPCAINSKIIMFPAAKHPKESIPLTQLFSQDTTIVEIANKLFAVDRKAFVNGTFGIFAHLQTTWREFEVKLVAERNSRREFDEMDLDDDEPLTTEALMNFGLEGARGGMVGEPRKVFPIKRKHLQKFSYLYRYEIQSHLFGLEKLGGVYERRAWGRCRHK
ncbi:hypothetical protein BC829DRAFT_213861 [Chytridium lagenaria]|nr:hypothetical protein BC829DRAFT_213861 [Chytridium lagenaria]